MEINNQKMFFCRIGYAQKYEGDPNDKLENGGSYNEHHIGGEFKNFYKESDGYYYGFFEPGNSDKNKKRARNQICVEKIDSSAKNKDYIDDVLVVFLSSKMKEKKRDNTVIIGWYAHATVYRYMQILQDGREYNLKCRIEDGTLLEEAARVFYPWKYLSSFGYFIGQSHAWYAELKKPGMQVFREKVLEYVENSSHPSHLASIENDGTSLFEEGRRRVIETNVYERNPSARRKCLEHYGTRCIICGFDSGEIYGEEFAGKIEVHHIIPISERNGQYELDPIKDLIPVCPNCHMILHSGKNGELIPWKTLKSKINNKI